MPDLFSQMMQQPQMNAGPQQPFTPEMEKQYQSWRAMKLDNWQKVLSNLASQKQVNTTMPPDSPVLRKHAMMMKVLGSDNPEARQMYLSEMAPAPQ